MEYSIEVITVPVTDVDRAKVFYTDQLGFRVDVDYAPDATFRVVQLTPPGSAASIQFGTGLTAATPGSMRSNYLVVKDVEAAHDQLTARGVPVSEIFHKKNKATWAGLYEKGTDPDRTPYASFLEFTDPDGNQWIMQERA